MASRLQDIADILGGLVLVYDNVEPLVAKADAQQADADRREPRQAARVRGQAARHRGRRAQVHRRGGRHARVAGAGAGRGDRRPDHPGRGQARHPDRRGLSGGAAPRARAWRGWPLALLLAGQAAAAPAASPPWQAAQRMQDSVFDAQSALLLDEPRSAVGLVRRAERQLSGPLAAGLRRDAPPPYRSVRRALADAERSARARDEIALGAARGRLRAALMEGSYAVTMAAIRDRRRPPGRELAAAARVPQGHPLHAAGRGRHARGARARPRAQTARGAPRSRSRRTCSTPTRRASRTTSARPRKPPSAASARAGPRRRRWPRGSGGSSCRSTRQTPRRRRARARRRRLRELGRHGAARRPRRLRGRAAARSRRRSTASPPPPSPPRSRPAAPAS